MTTEEFNNCTKENLLIGAKESFNQAKAHFQVAEEASKLGSYGIGTSLLILSVEESVKSMILAAGFFSIKFPHDVQPFFTNHKAKHDQAAEIQPVIDIFWKIKDAYAAITKKRAPGLGGLLGLTLDLAYVSVARMPAESFPLWWKQANRLKNNGFYVGFFNQKWVTPTLILKDNYIEALSMAQPFVECLEMINQLKPQDYQLLPSFGRHVNLENKSTNDQ